MVEDVDVLASLWVDFGEGEEPVHLFVEDGAVLREAIERRIEATLEYRAVADAAAHRRAPRPQRRGGTSISQARSPASRT